MSFIEFSNVTKIYKTGQTECRAADGVSFHVEQGELCVVVGSSGAGKTTILNMLGGMDSVTGGTVTVDGRDVSGFDRRQLTEYRRHDVGFVFQFYNLVQNLTASENVELASQICKNPKVLRARRGLSRRSCQAVNSSVLRLRAHLQSRPSCFCATSRRERWTIKPERRYFAFYTIPVKTRV